MGPAASVSIGNRTEANITNSTSNEQYFSMNTAIKVTNSMNQKTTSVNTLKEELAQQSKQEVSIVVDGMKVSGKYNNTVITASATSDQIIELIAEAKAVLEHVSNLTDAVMFDIANNGFSQQYSDMSSAARASSTTELDVSGFCLAAASVGINNTVCTNVNNSIRNVFSMAVNNDMSSATERASLVENINASSSVIEQVTSGKVGIKIKNLEIGGEYNDTTIDASTYSGMGAKLQENLTSNLTSSLTAITNTLASATSDVEASQKAKSSAIADSSQEQTTKISTNSAIWAIVAAVAVGTICAAVIGVAKSNGKQGNTDVVVNASTIDPNQLPLQL